MMKNKGEISKIYEAILQDFFAKSEEKAYFAVAELSKQLVLSQAGPDVLIDIHGSSLKALIMDVEPMTVSRMVVNANDLLLNGIMAYAMTYYGFMDQLDEERRKLEELNAETVALYQQIKEKNKELQNANDRLNELTRLKSQFLANMSHELRTPLNSIIGFTGIILQKIVGEINTEQEKQLNMVYDSAKHLLGLINDILDLSKIEAGRIEIIPAEFEIRGLIQTVAKMISPLSKEKGLSLQVALSEDVPAVIFHDQNRIKQVLINLLSNAVKFTPSGEIRITVQSVKTKEGKKPSAIEFSVADAGIGIRPEHIGDIFDEFRQIEGPLREKPVGTGLGLAISKKMVEMMGGSIRGESEYGKGSRFHFVLPVKEMPAPKGAPGILPQELAPGMRLVLIIDDEYEAQKILKTYLKNEGYEVIQAYNFLEAMELARKYRPFAITLDMVMPGKDGWDILHALKHDPLTEAIPVICVSILDNREMGLSLGAVEYLVKPVDKDEFIRELRRLAKDRPICDILIIDDDPKAVALLSQYFQEVDDYRVRKAYGGKEGLAKVKEQGPDLIILDLMMPEVDGFEVISHLKKSEETKHIPIIIVSGKDLTREEVAYLNSKIEKIIRKGDFRKEQLLEDIINALEKI